jgi:4-amino-4-deoxy-L-arabinose transferase-like glycosyltransferase
VSFPSEERRWIGGITLLALLLRTWIQALAPTIAADSAYYLQAARLVADGEFGRGVDHLGLHPLFPVLTAGAGLLTGRLDSAGTLVSILAGALTVFPLYSLLRLSWTPRLSAAACLVYALHPILAQETSEALPTGLFLLLFAAALALGLRGLHGGPFWTFPATGACCGLAYLTRTEGLMAPLLLLGAAGLALCGREATLSRRRILIGTAAALALGAAVSAPYVARLSRKAGRLAITGKGGGTVLFHAIQGERDAGFGPEGEHRFFPLAPRKLAFAFTPVLLPFLAAGFWLERRDFRRHAGGLLRACLAIAPPLALFLLNPRFRPSHRYFLAGVVLLLPWIAAAMAALVDRIRIRFPSIRWAPAAAIALLAALLLARSALPKRPEERALKEAGIWLSDRRPAGAGPWRIVTSSDKLAWYAGAEGIPFETPREDPEGATLSLLRSAEASHLALDSEGGHGPNFLEGLERRGLRRLESFRGSGRGRTLEVWIYAAP